jgi:hypothetical protein
VVAVLNLSSSGFCSELTDFFQPFSVSRPMAPCLSGFACSDCTKVSLREFQIHPFGGGSLAAASSWAARLRSASAATCIVGWMID